MNKSDAYSSCKRYMNKHVQFKTSDGKSYQGYIGNVDKNMVYVQVPEKSARKLESLNNNRGGCCVRPVCPPYRPPCPPYRPPYPPYRPPYLVSPAYDALYSPSPTRPPYPAPATIPPRPTAVSPVTAPPPPPAPVAAPVPVPVPVPYPRRGWCWLGIPLAFLAGLWIGEVWN